MSLDNNTGSNPNSAEQSSLEEAPLEEQELDAEITPSAPDGSDANLDASAPAGDARLAESTDPGRPTEGIAL